MPGEPTLLRVLVTRRHWQKFAAFAAQFRRAASELADQQGDPALRAVTISPRQFERWYGGAVKTLPYPDSCRVLEHMFGYPVHQLLAPASQLTDQQPPGPGPGQPGTPAAAGDRDPVPAGPSVTRSPVPGGVRDQGGWPAAGPALPDPERVLVMAARRAIRFAASADASNVGAGSIEQLHAETRRLALAYPRQPLPGIIGDIAWLQDHTFTLLEGRQRPGQARDLYVIGALASGMLAKAAHDLRDPQLAMTHARTALLCAGNAGHDALTAWVRGLQSLITYWDGRPREALQYALAGAQIPQMRGTVTVWLASLQARAWSALGNPAASHEAITGATSLRDQVIPDDLDELGGICRFSRPRQLYYAADAAAALPSPHPATDQPDELYTQAGDYATQAVTAYHNAPDDELSFGDEAGSRTALAIGRIRAGHLDGAREAVEPVLGLPAPQRIHGIISSVQNVHRAVAATAPREPLARQIQEEIEAYCRTPAAALPR
jgi:hypothetical protein